MSGESAATQSRIGLADPTLAARIEQHRVLTNESYKNHNKPFVTSQIRSQHTQYSYTYTYEQTERSNDVRI